jgi:ribosomal protein S18 acetylase RimI-like enzyme
VVFQAQDYDEANSGPLDSLVRAATDELPGHPDLKPPVGPELDPSRRGIFVVAYVHGQPVASGGYRIFPGDPTGETVELVQLYVSPAARRTGLGRALLVELEELARDDEYRRVVLAVGAEQHAAHGLYEFLGYRRVLSGERRRTHLLYGKDLDD